MLIVLLNIEVNFCCKRLTVFGNDIIGNVYVFIE